MTPFTFDPNADRVSDRYLFKEGALDTFSDKSNE